MLDKIIGCFSYILFFSIFHNICRKSSTYFFKNKCQKYITIKNELIARILIWDGISNNKFVDRHDLNACMYGFELGAISGAWGGLVYIPYFTKRFAVPAKYYIKEASEAVIPGVMKGNVVSGIDNFKNYCANKVKGWFSDTKQENSDAVPAT